jgi:hypothetical protein
LLRFTNQGPCSSRVTLTTSCPLRKYIERPPWNFGLCDDHGDYRHVAKLSKEPSRGMENHLPPRRFALFAALISRYVIF